MVCFTNWESSEKWTRELSEVITEVAARHAQIQLLAK